MNTQSARKRIDATGPADAERDFLEPARCPRNEHSARYLVHDADLRFERSDERYVYSDQVG
jgi:hypothetical protein